jgi:hypothetical protein
MSVLGHTTALSSSSTTLPPLITRAPIRRETLLTGNFTSGHDPVGDLLELENIIYDETLYDDVTQFPEDYYVFYDEEGGTAR